MFKNLLIYRLSGDWPASAKQLEEALAREPFAECGATQQKSIGWISPRGVDHGALVEAVNGQWIARLAIESRSVPADATRRHAETTAHDIEQRTGRQPGKREMRDLRDDALLALLPRAFSRRSHVTMWIDPRARRLMLDTTSQAKADDAISSLVRVAGRGFAIGLLQTQHTPQAQMATWLLAENSQTWPANFAIGRECELKASGDEPAVVKFTRHDLTTDEIREHIGEGKQPTQLALDWQTRVRFVLTQDLKLKKISFDEGVFDRDATVAADERFDADTAIATGELAPLIDDLLAALGGEATPAMPSGFTAAPETSDHYAPNAAIQADDPPF